MKKKTWKEEKDQMKKKEIIKEAVDKQKAWTKVNHRMLTRKRKPGLILNMQRISTIMAYDANSTNFSLFILSLRIQTSESNKLNDHNYFYTSVK